MKKLLIYLLCILLFTPASCQEKNKKNNMSSENFEWIEASAAALGFPIDVYRGGLESADGSFTSLYSGTISGNHGWGSPARGMSNGFKPVPNHLHVIWVSYAEKQFYEIDIDIDQEKMVELFRKGYYTPSDGDNPNPRKENYNQIVVGFAPGGVVVVWLSGAGRQTEIGRYEGKKLVIPQEEISGLSPGPQKNMFNPEYQRKIMYEFDIVPLEVVKANENKPIPYGLWDSYRQKYNWRVEVELPDNGKSKVFTHFHFNGEMEMIFGETQIAKYNNIIPKELKWNTSKERTVPYDIKFEWMDGVDGHRYVCNIKFDEKEIFSAFKEISSSNSNGEIKLQIRVNNPKTSASVQLIKGEKQVWLKDNEIMMRKTKYTN